MNPEFVFPLADAGWPAFLVDSSGSIHYANKAAVGIFGAACEGKSARLAALWAAENLTTPEKLLAEGEKSNGTRSSVQLRGKTGESLAYDAALSSTASNGQKYLLLQLLPAAKVPSAAPRTDAGETTALAHRQKLDCALQLARTVALDFNNALTSILGHTSLVLSKMEPNHPWRNSLLEVEKSAARAAEIAGDLGTFSRQEKEARSQASGNLNLLLQRSVQFFQQNPGAVPIEWKFQLDRRVFAAKFDEAKMQQVFLKVLENSVQSLGERGRITVQTRNLELGEATQDRNVRLAPGAYVCVEIADNGCGIEADILPRIFEPFFTTKKDAKHRGLGLAWVYGIVTNHGGGVAVSSEPGSGTSVRIYLPAENRSVRDNGVPQTDLTGHETVLMVDDEDLLLTMGETILSAYGYRVLTANSGQKALGMLTKNEASIDLVVTDLVMPGMSGRELIEQIHKLSPGTRVLSTSGYVWPVSRENPAAYLQKPFTSQELLSKVKQALSEAG